MLQPQQVLQSIIPNIAALEAQAQQGWQGGDQVRHASILDARVRQVKLLERECCALCCDVSTASICTALLAAPSISAGTVAVVVLRVLHGLAELLQCCVGHLEAAVQAERQQCGAQGQKRQAVAYLGTSCQVEGCEVLPCGSRQLCCAAAQRSAPAGRLSQCAAISCRDGCGAHSQQLSQLCCVKVAVALPREPEQLLGHVLGWAR